MIRSLYVGKDSGSNERRRGIACDSSERVRTRAETSTHPIVHISRHLRAFPLRNNSGKYYYGGVQVGFPEYARILFPRDERSATLIVSSRGNCRSTRVLREERMNLLRATRRCFRKSTKIAE